MTTKLTRTPGIYLVGFMGSGKTTVGSLLAEELGWDFVDLDHDIEAAARKTISEIFETEGEQEFRRQERAALLDRVNRVRSGRPLVLSLGGGAFTQDEICTLVNENGVSIWLDASFALIRERIAGESHRPLAKDPEQFARLYEERQASYARADHRIHVDSNDAAAVVKAILAIPLY